MVYIECMETVTFDLKDWRESRQWSKAYLAALFGVSRWTVKRMEDAGKVPRPVFLLCGLLKAEETGLETPILRKALESET